MAEEFEQISEHPNIWISKKLNMQESPYSVGIDPDLFEEVLKFSGMNKPRRERVSLVIAEGKENGAYASSQLSSDSIMFNVGRFWSNFRLIRDKVRPDLRRGEITNDPKEGRLVRMIKKELVDFAKIMSVPPTGQMADEFLQIGFNRVLTFALGHEVRHLTGSGRLTTEISSVAMHIPFTLLSLASGWYIANNFSILSPSWKLIPYGVLIPVIAPITIFGIDQHISYRLLHDYIPTEKDANKFGLIAASRSDLNGAISIKPKKPIL